MGNSAAETSWVVRLVNLMTAPAKKMTQDAEELAESFDLIGESAKDSMEDVKKAIDVEKSDLKSYKSELSSLEKELSSLEKAKKKAAPGKEWSKVNTQIEKTTSKVEEYKNRVKETEAEIERLTSVHDKLREKQERQEKNWTNIATGINQTAELLTKLSDSMSFVGDIDKVRSDIARFTGQSKDQVAGLTQEVMALANAYGDAPEEIVKSANAMSKKYDMAFDDVLKLYEKGYQIGSNLNGDMLRQVEEYSTFTKQMGLSAADSFALMAKANKDGVFDDKALDSLKEADLSLREMTQTQVDALKGIGLEVKDLAGKTTWEAVQMISRSMDGATTAAKQAVVADIFKGAGEDAGLAWIEGLGSIDMDINNIPAIQNSSSSIQTWVDNIKTWFATSFTSVAMHAQSLATVAATITPLIGLVEMVRKSTMIATAAQWAWNVALTANPIGVLVVAIGALVAGIVVAYKKFDGFKKVVDAVGKTIKHMFIIPIKTAIAHVKNLVMGVANLGKAIYKFITLDFKGAMEDGINAAEQLSGVATAKEMYKFGKEAAEDISSGFKAGYKNITSPLDAVKAAMVAKNSQIVDYMKRMGDTHGTTYVNQMIEKAEGWAKYMDQMYNTTKYTDKVKAVVGEYSKNKNTIHDNGTLLPPKNSKGGGAKEGGMSIAGSGGTKAITMNLDVKNYFNNVSSQMDVQKIAEKITTMLNDRIKDGLITAG